MPARVQQGGGICRFCAGMQWDAFYVVTNPTRHWLKFGITSRDGRPRLRRHAQSGFTVVNLLLTNLPGTVAPEAESAILATLGLASESPVRGREYFDVSLLGLVLDVAEAHLAGYPIRVTPIRPGAVGYTDPAASGAA